MEEININPTLNRIVKLLYFLGIWNDYDESILREKIRKFLYLGYFLLFLTFLAICACVAAEKDEFIFLSLIVIIVGVIALKLAYLLYKKNEIIAFLHYITAHRVDPNDGSEKMKPFLKFVNGYIFTLIVAAVFYNVSCLPMLSSEKRLPFFIRYSLTWKHTDIIYWIVFVFDGTAIFYCNLSNVITPIIWYLMLSYGVGYEVLGDKFRNLGTSTISTVGMKETTTGSRKQKKSLDDRNKCLQDFIDLVKTHRNLFT